MAIIQYESLLVTATSSGSIGTYTSKTWLGYVHTIVFAPTTSSTGLTTSTGGSFAITAERSGLPVFALDDTSTTKAGTYYPRSTTVTTTGAASTGAVSIPLYNERMLVTMTSGSTTATTHTATFYFYVS